MTSPAKTEPVAESQHQRPGLETHARWLRQAAAGLGFGTVIGGALLLGAAIWAAPSDDAAPRLAVRAPVPAPPVGLEVLVSPAAAQAQPLGGARVLVPGESLQGGDRIAVRVTPLMPAQVHVLLISLQDDGNGGVSDLVAMARRDRRLPVGVPTTLPSTGAFELDGHPGEEILVALALPGTDAGLEQILSSPQAAASARELIERLRGDLAPHAAVLRLQHLASVPRP